MSVPYGCARGSLTGALDCIASPELTDVDQLFARTTAHEREATIAPTINMKRDKVYVFHGSKDTRVDPGFITILLFNLPRLSDSPSSLFLFE